LTVKTRLGHGYSPMPAPSKSPQTRSTPEVGGTGSLSFEQVLENLENVVSELERGELPLEQALVAFERGVTLSRKGASLLDDAERRIEVLLGQGEATEPLAAERLPGFEKEQDNE